MAQLTDQVQQDGGPDLDDWGAKAAALGTGRSEQEVREKMEEPLHWAAVQALHLRGSDEVERHWHIRNLRNIVVGGGDQCANFTLFYSVFLCFHPLFLLFYSVVGLFYSNFTRFYSIFPSIVRLSEVVDSRLAMWRQVKIMDFMLKRTDFVLNVIDLVRKTGAPEAPDLRGRCPVLSHNSWLFNRLLR